MAAEWKATGSSQPYLKRGEVVEVQREQPFLQLPELVQEARGKQKIY
jgi:hypothetical protein